MCKLSSGEFLAAFFGFRNSAVQRSTVPTVSPAACGSAVRVPTARLLGGVVAAYYIPSFLTPHGLVLGPNCHSIPFMILGP